ncbi:hypothetical protein PLCT2_02487 [Planctomycetaceae bacterium]|nr:hypothetical protein PLCT2_02487 [Planctomycetaceae bacterium]
MAAQNLSALAPTQRRRIIKLPRVRLKVTPRTNPISSHDIFLSAAQRPPQGRGNYSTQPINYPRQDFGQGNKSSARP